MAVDVQWIDNKTIKTTFTAPWSWDEFTAALDTYHTLASNMMHDSYHVVDLRECGLPSNDSSDVIPHDLRQPHANTAMTILVGGDAFSGRMMHLLSGGNYGHQLVTVETLDDAETLIGQHQRVMDSIAS